MTKYLQLRHSFARPVSLIYRFSPSDRFSKSLDETLYGKIGPHHSTNTGHQERKQSNKSLENRYSSVILTLWMQQHSSLHKKLSFNITREICSYQGGNSQQLVSILSREVLRFDSTTDTPRRLWKLNAEIKAGHLYASVFIAENTVFCCGGYQSFHHTHLGDTCTCHVDSNAYILRGDGSVRTLPHMSMQRHSHGIFYREGEVYVFGGANVNYLALKLCERFVISTNKWGMLPKMRVARCGFNPCWYSSAVYICGGMQTSIEIFDLQSITFTLVPGVYLPEAECCTTVITTKGELVVISRNYICRLQSSGFASLQHSPYRPYSYCSPLMRGVLIYLVTAPTICYGINSVTGELNKEISLRYQA